MTKVAIQAASQAKKNEQIIHMGQNHKILKKSDRKQQENAERQDELEKHTKINTGAVKSGNCIDVDLVFDANNTIDKFMVMVSTQYKQELNHAKKTTA